MLELRRVNVYDEQGKIIGRVKVNRNLDTWYHNDYCYLECPGMHKGVTRLINGRYVFILTYDWDEDDFAEITTEEEVIKEILDSGNDQLLQIYELEDKVKEILLYEEDIN